MLAAVLSAPTLYRAFVVGDLETSTALTRVLLAVVVSAAMLAVLRGLASYFRQQREEQERREVERREQATPVEPTGVEPTSIE
jgi:hypothetical protein